MSSVTHADAVAHRSDDAEGPSTSTDGRPRAGTDEPDAGATFPSPGTDPTRLFRLDGRLAMVTGASSGLGARFSRVLDCAGAKVLMVARRESRLQVVAAGSQQAVPAACDITDRSAVERLFEWIADEFGPLDILVNNAGVSITTPASDLTMADFRHQLEVNLIAPMVLAQAAARSMVANGGGTIVNVASVIGMVATPDIPLAGYAASKGGLISLTRDLAAEWSAEGVRVNALVPGWFKTEMTEEMFESGRGAEWVAGRTLLQRIGRAHELDGALLYLSSDASSYMQGQTLVVDGGWTAM